MELTPVVWVIPHIEFDLGPIPEQLLVRGFRILRSLPGASQKAEVQLRVLQADLFPDVRKLRDEYESVSIPTLVVASSIEQEVAVIDFLSETGDVMIGLQSVEVLAFRFSRLLKHSSGLKRISVLQNDDPLTGLPNRSRFQSLLAEFSNAETAGCRAVVLLDLDHFKQANDQFGHAVGDQILREVAVLLQQGAAPGDRFARFGGEEFAWLMSRYDPDTVVKDVHGFLKRVEDNRFQAFPPDQNDAVTWASGVSLKQGSGKAAAPSLLERPKPTPVRMTISAGMTFVRPGASAKDLLHQADLAMYEAKGRGRNQAVVYEQLQASAAAEDKDLNVEHFKNVTRVLTERVMTLVTQIGENLVEEAKREANHDALTRLHNRRYFDARLIREIERAGARDRDLTVALMDLDRFGEVNKTFGYPTGDRVLSRFAEIAAGCVRSLDWLARYGGEEFCLVMPDTALDTGVQVAERIRAAVESTTIQSLDQRRVPLTVSIGVVQFSSSLDGAIGLIEKASGAVLEAKRAGRNRVVSHR